MKKKWDNMSDTPHKSPDNPPSTTPLSEPGAHAPPQVDYELIRLIGHGAYGEVWLVRDQAGKFFACKVVYRESFQHDRPYEREYKGICKFEPVSRANENQLKILHVGRRDALGYFYYLMELADDATTGAVIHSDAYVPKTLHSELENKKRLPVAECIQIGLSLCAALESLHQHGLIHRDIKPGNIVFINGVPKLADIGLVTDLDMTISYVGTEGFIPPEGPTSARADIYGLGKVLYEISTGKDRLQYPELPADFSEIPDWEQLLELNAIITKACEANPRKRYASADEMRADLALLAAGKSVRNRRATSRRRRLAVKIGSAIAAVGLIAWGITYLSSHPPFRQPTPQVKLVVSKTPLPDEARVAQCESKIKEKYEHQINGKAEDKQHAAADLYDQSMNETDSAMELADLRIAARLTAEAANYTRAMQICDRMNDRFEIAILPIKADLLSSAASDSHAPKNKSDLTDVCLATGFQAIAANDYASAGKMVALAKVSAAQSGDAHLVWQADFLANQTTNCASAFDKVKQFAVRLRDNPTDAAASLVMGKFLCFTKSNWAAGLPLLAQGNDAALKQIANDELSIPPKDASQQIALGKSWWALSTAAPANEKQFYAERARYWCLHGIASSREADRSQLRQSLSDIIKSIPTQSAQLNVFSRLGGTEFIDIYADRAEWRSSQRGTEGNKINYVSVGDFGSGDVEIINNYGATWLMSSTVDFSTAKLEDDRTKGRRRAPAKLVVFDDHVRLMLSHQRTGTAGMDVTIIFGGAP